MQTPALRAVGNVVGGDDAQTQVMIDAGVLPNLHALLRSPRKAIRKEVCWVVSNVIAGNEAQIQAVFDAHLIPPLVRLLQSASTELSIKKEAVWAVRNATERGSAQQIAALVAYGCVQQLCALLASPASDAALVTVARSRGGVACS